MLGRLRESGLLKALEGPVAPAAWRGSLPITYHIGPGPARVHLAVKSNYQVTPAYEIRLRDRVQECNVVPHRERTLRE